MKNIIDIIQQSFFSFFGRIFAVLVGFWYKYYLVDNLENPTYALGLFGLGLTLANLTAPFSSLGMARAANKYIPIWNSKHDSKRIVDYARLSLSLTFIISILIAVAAWIYQDHVILNFSENNQVNDLRRYFPYFLLIMICKNLLDNLQAIMIGLKDVKKNVSYGVFLSISLKVILVMLLLYLGMDLNGYIYGEVSTILVISLIFITLVLRRFPFKLWFSRLNLNFLTRDYFSYIGSMFFLGVLGILSTNMDKILLAQLSISDLGIYYMLFLFTPFVSIILFSVNSIFAPIISEIYSENKLEELKQLYQFFTKWTFILTTPLFFFLMYFRNEVLLFFGEEFTTGSTALAILLFGQMISVAFGSIGTILQMTGKHVKVLKINFLQAGIVVGFMFWLIPKYGLVGAAISSSIGVILSNIFNYTLVYKSFKFIPYKNDFIKIGLVLTLSAAILHFMFNSITIKSELIYLTIYFIATAVVVLLISRALCFNSEDKQVLSQILKRK